MRRICLITFLSMILLTPSAWAENKAQMLASSLIRSQTGLWESQTSTGPERELDVPYVPTPARVVKKMIEVARIGPEDVVYDLGCGDGRIVIRAAKEKGARAVGVDINPERIKESRENARRAKVGEKVTFLEQDLFKTDISEATVLTLYLLRSVNLQLRPRILSQLKPGARVVSYDYDMGEWEPDRIVEGSDLIYFWVVPSNVSGTWGLQVEAAATPFTLTIRQRFQKIQGAVTSGNGQMSLKDPKLMGEKLEFTLEQTMDGRKAAVRFEGRVKGDVLQGSMKQMPGDEGIGTWKARRNPSTKAPIDRSEEYPRRLQRQTRILTTAR